MGHAGEGRALDDAAEQHDGVVRGEDRGFRGHIGQRKRDGDAVAHTSDGAKR